ncbi:GPI ethanolamine phosphate transferase 1 [Drosophila kikkawai]|uniref:GPI ethanolamine phosphate transferase 1 n=1 Tax=Drosophila kikkawai TaxID=30033 RepID=A0A6P4JIL3_DROKI|nr:GPI ethanolamine phosphate transferase 1 [Drosophila kikkawai]
MWRLRALVVHIFLLASILTTYFSSTILPGLVPQKTMREMGFEPPADRLVVFLTDGFRAASFLAKNGSVVPDLRNLYRTQGRIAISRSLTPTQTAVGHIAIFGGLMQDPTAVLVNFRYVPVHFDTVFNRSRMTIGWDDDFVDHVFRNQPHGGAPLRIKTGDKKDMKFDAWVFGQVKEFLARSDNVREVRNHKGVVFFVYLADLDAWAHRYSPLLPEFDQQLLRTQKGIHTTYELFEKTFNDSRTAYLLTSDHGMGNTGMHGGSSRHERETPLFMWGAGVKRTVGPNAAFPTWKKASRVEQIQLAPLMSAFIGLPPPMNNIAMMPRGYLNVSTEYEAMAFHLNALQILDQAEIVISRNDRSLFCEWLPRFKRLDLKQIAAYKANFKSLVSQGHSQEAMEECQRIIKLAQKCVKYYQGYYQTPLLVATTISYLVWLYCLLLQLTRIATENQRKGFVTLSTVMLSALGIIELVLLVLQKVPFFTSVCLLLPTCLLIMAQAERSANGPWIKAPLMNLFSTLVPAALIILVYFEYKHFAELYVLSLFLHYHRLFRKPSLKFFLWMILVCIISASLFLSQYTQYGVDPELLNFHVLQLGMLVALVRPIILRHKIGLRVWAINAMTFAAGAYGVKKYVSKEVVPDFVKATTWFFLVYAFLSIRYSDASFKTAMRRLALITMNMITLHALLCERWGSWAMQILSTELIFGLQMYEDSKRSDDNYEGVGDRKPLLHLKQSYRYGFAIVLYFYVTFALAGNWIGSFIFWPNTARLFYAHYSLFVPGCLIILKIVLPSLIVISTLYALVPFVRQNIRSTFTCVLLISNVMGLYFCYYVKKRGAYDDVRNSLDKLLITHVVNLLLLGCCCIVVGFLHDTEMRKPKSKKERRVRFTSANEESRV